ncbi:MAG: peptidoglycan editing factor PgeF [Candidatus Nitrohelix vancouverensis]|uniref:Purine nucleoside phosphorylase n=1 Tax=Candidatus Nitrohelix vancouverensis TaxID=2705534 RepID=A0A7T0C1N8_9BACT|nr:MAG: peptidoglycan editing factor PgeF [Candidatus Nitrohelix vancouverensis]
MITFKILEEEKKILHGTSLRESYAQSGSTRRYKKIDSDAPRLAKQRESFCNDIYDAKRGTFFLMKQVHGDAIYFLKNEDNDPMATREICADAIVTHLVERPVGVLTADCIPVLVFDPKLKICAAIHAGRKGSGLRIFYKTVRAMQKEYGCASKSLIAAIGPGICGACYEVEEDCLQAFKDNFDDWTRLAKRQTNGKFLLDLVQANREDALEAGILEDRLSLSGHCTACRTDMFYSYRKEGATGRLLTAAMLLTD